MVFILLGDVQKYAFIFLCKEKIEKFGTNIVKNDTPSYPFFPNFELGKYPKNSLKHFVKYLGSLNPTA